MLSTSALTWVAAQERKPVYELIRILTPMDEMRIEAAYAEWRRRAAAGERRHKVDWRTYPLPEAEVVAAEQEPVSTPAEAIPTSAPTDEPVPASIEDVEADAPVPASIEDVKADEPVPTSVEDVEADEADSTDPDIADAVEQIMAVEEPEYISLDDFNLEPSEAEMKAMERDFADDLSSAEEDQEALDGEAVPTEAEEAVEEVTPADVERIETATEAEAAPPTEERQSEEAPIEQRISKLGKDATEALYESILTRMAGDVDTLKAVVESVIRDHTRRHRGTAAQRAFLAWLNER